MGEREVRMPGLRLEVAKKKDKRRLVKNLPLLLKYLGAATADALQLKDYSIVGIKVIRAQGIQIARVEVVAEVSQDQTPGQDTQLWLGKLEEAWTKMRKDPKVRKDPNLKKFVKTINGSVGFWPQLVMKGIYSELPAATTVKKPVKKS